MKEQTSIIEKLPTWKNAKELIENFKYIIFERNGSDSKSLLATQEILKQNKNNFEFLDEKKYSNVSSGIIRELIQNENYKECEKYTKPEIVPICQYLPWLAQRRPAAQHRPGRRWISR